MKRVVIIGAGARGNRVFAELIAMRQTGFELAGVVEIDRRKREAFQRFYGIPKAHAFASADAFLATEPFADIAFICTPDPTHFTLAKAVSEAGYDVLLEKPIATNLADCLALVDVQQTQGNEIIVAHVLRYAPFFRALREIVDSGRLGPIRHVQLSENIGHWHFAHSYVRGNWRRSDTSAPIILTKSCHDLDILHWLIGGRVRAVSSRGGLTYFREESAPDGAAERCVDCIHQDDCLYSATRFYLNERDAWPYNVVTPLATSMEGRRRAIETGPYGRCVYRNDNDVCDDQVVVMEFENGVVATFSLHALTAENTRKLTMLFDGAQLEGDLLKNEIVISHFTGRPDEVRRERIKPAEDLDHQDYHGGGDAALLHALYAHLNSNGKREIVSSLRSALASHALAFLAEESRQNGGVTLPVPEVFSRHPHRPKGRTQRQEPAA